MEPLRSAIITGPTGAIGRALIAELIRRGVRVTAVCRPDSERISAVPNDPLVRIVECDLGQLKDLPNLLSEQYDAFFHLGWASAFGAAARDDMDAQINNIRCALEAVRSAHALGCSVFVGAGSQAEYGRVEGLLRPDTPCFPENGYGMAKLCAGQMTRVECEKLGMRHVWARVLSVYGPGDGEGTLISTLIRTLLAGEKPSCTMGGQQWDYLYSADAARAFHLLAERGRHGGIYPLGGGAVRPLKDYIRAVRDAIDPALDIGFGEIPYAKNQVMYLCADLTALTADTGFTPATSFEEGIRNTIAGWMR